ncbi:hypothetical protein OC846_004609 [Tilletia horrida]|uniref:Uncharacterized protein n=1 Tax=Tilletia horrida TaxID=155126 RepID=A0AAN6JQN0_9BASI|nr:hypothetical protein OC846_004609 [Tilletia horrida]KAK0554074.1 hypothetical protein OC845_000888 [Tilletia horrida]KAK0565507.1 hypothetical protein OC861_003730 [Tilletia horrida]
MESTPSNQDDSRSAVSSAPSRKITASKMRSKWSFKYLLPHHLLRFLLRILLTPIWLFTSVPHSSQAVVDAQPWGIRVLLFPLRLFAAVPGSIGTFWLLRNTWVGIRNEGFGPWTKPAKLGSGREEHPPAVVFAIASLWSLSTAYYALSLTTLLLRRWLLYYSPLSSIIRLVALQAICWPLVRITLFVFGPHRPLEAWILIATTTTFSDTVARWLVSNIVDRIDGGLDAWVGEESDLGWGSRSQSRNADWEREGDDSTQMGQSERHQRRRDRRRRGPVLAGGRSEEEGSEPNGHAHRPERERRLRARSSYPDRMLRNDVGAALLAFEVKDTTTDDTGSGSEVDLDVDLEVYPDGTTRRRRRHPRDRRGTSSRRHPPQGRMSASEGFRYEHPSPRRTASFPRLPTSDLLFDTPPSSSSSTSATSSSSAGTASDGEHNQGGRDRRATRRARQAANGTGAAGGGDGAESGADETPLTLMLPVRRVFHWDVAIKRNILPMGVLAYVSLWVLLGHSRVEGRGR